MSERKIAVPEGMLKAALDGLGIEIVEARRQYVENALEAALRWLSLHPVVPTKEQTVVLRDLDTNISAQYGQTAPTCASVSAVVTFWQRRMFLAPEQEVIPVAQTIDLIWKAPEGDSQDRKDARNTTTTFLKPIGEARKQV
jgi:hypothetical protein